MTIAITALTRKTAIMRLFRQCRADQAGSQVLLTVLMTAWTQLGLPHFQINPDRRIPALAIAALNSQNPGVSQLAVALFAANPPLPGIVLQNTFGIHQSEVDSLTASGKAWLDGVGVNPQQMLEQERILREVQQRASQRLPDKPGQEPRWRIVDRRVQLD